MRVNKRDGRCRECGGTLVIVDADDATMTVECQECGDSYAVEPDAFGDGAVVYYPAVMAELGEDRDED
jgi:transcription elongation factor Elf1